MTPESDVTIEIVEETPIDMNLVDEQPITIELKETGAKGDKGDDGDAGDDGADGLSAYEIWLSLGNTGTEEDFFNALGGVSDEPSTFLNFDNKVAGLLGEYITGGVLGRMWYNRQGRHIRGHVAIFGNANNDWGGDPFKSVLVKPTDLPFIPRNFGEIPEVQYPITEVGNFGLVASNNGVDVSIGGSIGSAFSTVGQYPTPQMIFFKAVDFTDGQLGNLVYDNNPVPLVGMNWNIIARFSYEAAYEQGYIGIEDGFAVASETVEYSDEVDIIISSGYQLPFDQPEIIDGALPDGLSLSLDETTISLTGTPTEFGTFDFTIELTAANGDSVQKDFSIVVSAYEAALVGDYTSDAMVNFEYDDSITLSSIPSQLPITAEITSGQLPAGLSITIENDNEIRISGTPTTAENQTMTLTVTDANEVTYEKVFAINVAAYNPEVEPLYLGTVSGGSYNINFVNGNPSVNILSYSASAGEILKIRSSTMNQDFGEGTITVLVGEYMIFEGGYWRKYIYA